MQHGKWWAKLNTTITLQTVNAHTHYFCFPSELGVHELLFISEPLSPKLTRIGSIPNYMLTTDGFCLWNVVDLSSKIDYCHAYMCKLPPKNQAVKPCFLCSSSQTMFSLLVEQSSSTFRNLIFVFMCIYNRHTWSSKNVYAFSSQVFSIDFVALNPCITLT